MRKTTFVLTVQNIPHKKHSIDLTNPLSIRLKVPFIKRLGFFKLQVLANNGVGKNQWITVGNFKFESSAILAEDYLSSLILFKNTGHEIIDFYTD